MEPRRTPICHVVAGKRLALHFADTPPTNLFTGMIVQVEGVQVADQLASTSSGTTTSSTTGASGPSLPNTFGQQNMLVILVNFQDDIQPITPADASLQRHVLLNQAAHVLPQLEMEEAFFR